MTELLFRLVPTWVTLNDVALILHYFTEFDSLAGPFRHSDRRKTFVGEMRRQ